MINIVINDSSYEVDDGTTVCEVLDLIGADHDRVAVVLNEDVVPKARRTGTTVHDGDRVDVLVFAAGG